MEFEAITSEWIKELEGGYAHLDNDDPTMWGINATIHPDLAGKILNKSLSFAEAERRLRRDYLYSFFGWEWMMDNTPDLLWLLYIGAIHGAGDNHLVELIQRWAKATVTDALQVDGVWGPKTLNVVKSLDTSQLQDLRTTISNSIGTLSARRARSVSGYEDAIRARVVKEHSLSQSLLSGVQRTMIAGEARQARVEDMNDGYVRIHHPRFEILIKEKTNEPESNTNSGTA